MRARDAAAIVVFRRGMESDERGSLKRIVLLADGGAACPGAGIHGNGSDERFAAFATRTGGRENGQRS